MKVLVSVAPMYADGRSGDVESRMFDLSPGSGPTRLGLWLQVRAQGIGDEDETESVVERLDLTMERLAAE